MNMEQAELLWTRVLDSISKLIAPGSFDTWFRPLKVIGCDDYRIFVECCDMVTAKTLKTRYYSIVSGVLEELSGTEYSIVFLEKGEPMPSVAPQKQSFLSELNPKYTFDTFVVGASNRFAHAAARAVAEMPSEAYNPLFLYGGVGLGKTHLMHAIGHYVLAEKPNTKVLYISSETFTNQLIEAITHKTNQDFRDKLRNVDILMVDDIQFIAGKTATQEEFFHTFNHLHGSGKQIIISSDRPPKDIPTLEERLTSRFEWGLIADIQKPDYETRCAILREKARQDRIEVPDEVITYIATNVESNIRELEGYLTRVIASAQLQKVSITPVLAENTLNGVMANAKHVKKLTPDLIMDTVSKKFGVDRASLTSTRRNREIAQPRQICMYLLREMTNLSTTRIGDAFGGRDHTTVMHACDKAQEYINENPDIAKMVREIREEIGK